MDYFSWLHSGFGKHKPEDNSLEAIANNRGYSWMSGEYQPDGGYLIRARGAHVKSISWKGASLDDAKGKARAALNGMAIITKGE